MIASSQGRSNEREITAQYSHAACAPGGFIVGVDEALNVGWRRRLEVELDSFVCAVEHSDGFSMY